MLSKINNVVRRGALILASYTLKELAMIAGALGLFACGIIIIWLMTLQIPSIGALQNRKVVESTKIYDRTGKVLLYDVHGAVRRTEVPLEKISKNLQNAVIAIEDTQFYQHHGIRPLAILRSLFINVTSGGFSQGGSTITQQVVKMTLLTNEKTIVRKLEEWVLAMKLERVYSKDQILETYLNEAPFGGTIYGVEEASQYFFGKHASDVDIAEAAYLSSLPQAPTYYSPFGNHRGALETKKNLVLKRMLENKFITQDEYEAATSEKVAFIEQGSEGIKAPHFVFFVREYLEQKYGPEAVDQNGLQVVTTLDWDLQQRAEKIIHDGALSNEKNFNASNAGTVAIDSQTGQILVMVGSRDYFDPNIDGKVNITLAERQPGSSFKPFVYATALKKGYTPETVVFDLKTQFTPACGPDNFSDDPPCYSPENFDLKFKGPVTLRDALAQSINIPAIKVLYLSGIANAIKTAQDLGVTTLRDPDRYGLTLVLGGGEVNLLEMTSAYGVFGNDGVRNPPTAILSVADPSGRTLEQFHDQSATVIDQNVARTISNMLSDNVARTPEFGADSPLNFPGYDVADKTGTTNDYRDAWIIGYTPRVAVGAWAGNNDNTPMQKKIAAFIIAPLWHQIMAAAIEKYPAGAFPTPEPEPANLPPALSGNWDTNPTMGVHDILFWVNKGNPTSGSPDRSDPQLAQWDYPVSIWASQNVSAQGPSSPHGQAVQIRITNPSATDTLPVGQILTISVTANDISKISKVSYYINGAYIGTSTNTPFSLQTVPRQSGVTQIRAAAQTQDGISEATVTFLVR